jgi:hypothetical protein
VVGLDQVDAEMRWSAERGTHWVIDGAHTISAHRQAGKKEVRAIVATGSYIEAWEAAAHENQTHGVPLRNADKRARVELAVKVLPGMVEDWPWSARRLASFCGVTHDLVNRMNVLTVEESSTSRTGKDGVKQPARKPPKAREKPADDTPTDAQPDRKVKAAEPEFDGQVEDEPASISADVVETEDEGVEGFADREGVIRIVRRAPGICRPWATSLPPLHLARARGSPVCAMAHKFSRPTSTWHVRADRPNGGNWPNSLPAHW